MEPPNIKIQDHQRRVLKHRENQRNSILPNRRNQVDRTLIQLRTVQIVFYLWGFSLSPDKSVPTGWVCRFSNISRGQEFIGNGDWQITLADSGHDMNRISGRPLASVIDFSLKYQNPRSRERWGNSHEHFLECQRRLAVGERRTYSSLMHGQRVCLTDCPANGSLQPHS